MDRQVISHWEPELPSFWLAHGEPIAKRNLWISIITLMLAFAVWVVWSVVVVNLPAIGFRYSTNQLFWLTALPGISGATLRIFYAFMVPIFGGRKWTTFATASLLIPALGIGFAVQDPDTSYPLMLTLALLCGLGGGNFASSMANISFFFPSPQKGHALGLNAGLGNLGVSLAQLLIPLVITVSLFGAPGGEPQHWVKDGVSKVIWLQNAGFIWVPLILVATAAAWFGMHDLNTVQASFSEQAVIFKRKHNWLMSWLYVGTFGSSIGFAAGLPLLTQTQYPQVDALQFAFYGPLLGSLTRAAGGWLADHLGGARLALWMFVCMIAAVLGVLYYLPGNSGQGQFAGFFCMFLFLFASSGIGNAAIFRMIPIIFLTEHLRAVAGQSAAVQARARQEAGKEAAAVLGFTSAIAAFGAFFVPKSYGTSIALSGGPQAALWIFIGFYLSCVYLTWFYYARKDAPMPC